MRVLEIDLETRDLLPGPLPLNLCLQVKGKKDFIIKKSQTAQREFHLESPKTARKVPHRQSILQRIALT